jgi:hypothetical protein
MFTNYDRAFNRIGEKPVAEVKAIACFFHDACSYTAGCRLEGSVGNIVIV